MILRCNHIFVFLYIILFSACQTESDPWQSLHPNMGLSDFQVLNGTANYERTGNTITGTTTLNSPNTFLATKKTYGDFELSFSVLLTEGLNSGVQIRSLSDTSIMKGRVHGYQVEIEDSPRGWAGGIYDEARRGWLYSLERNAKGRVAFKKGEWNAYHILAKGDTLQTWLNGIPIGNLVDTLTAEGFIALQVHAIGDSAQTNQTIQWKDLKIKTERIGEELKDWPRAPLATILPAQTNNLDEFQLEEGYYIHQLAGEPQVESPVAAELDERGNIWVVELPGYMRDIDGSEEDKADGRIVVLSDIDKDGVMDKREVYKDGLVAPRAICLAYNGLLYNNGRALYFDDFKNGTTVLIDSFYVQGGNIEHQPNGLYYNLDNWIYSAKSNARYRQRDWKWIKEATTLRGQWGINADLHGRLIYNDNSNGLYGDRVLPNSFSYNKHLPIKENLINTLSTDNRVYPVQATAVNRGYIKGVLDEQDKLKNFTSSCSPIIYKGQGPLFRNAFTCAPEVNLVKRYVPKKNAPLAQDYQQAYANQEFLISTDESFRPVNIYNNPKGGLLLVDLRKGIIQHRAYMTNYLREKIIAKGQDKMVGKGRLYLITDSSEPPGDLSMWPKDLNPKQKSELLAHENGGLRLAMQKHLVAGVKDYGYKESREDFGKLFHGDNDFGKIHAYWTALGAYGIEPDTIAQLFESTNPQVIYQLLAALSTMDQPIRRTWFQAAMAFKNPEIDLVLCQALREIPNEIDMLLDLVRRYQNSPAHVEALLARSRSELISPAVQPNSLLQKEWNKYLQYKSEGRDFRPAIITNQYSDNRNEGFPAYNKYCGSCHGLDGIGQANLAPPLLYSEYVEGPSDKLAALILQGLQGPVTVNGKTYDLNLVMPGLKYNTEVTDEVISAIIAFVNNAFSKSGEGIPAEKIKGIREKLEGKAEPLTEQEVLGWQ